MKTKTLALLFISILFITPIYAQEAPAQPAAKAPEAAAAPAEQPAKAGEEFNWKIGKELDGETITKIITDLAIAAKEGKDFWRSPSFWEAVWVIVLVVLAFLAAKFGWTKKKWGKIIQAVEKAVNTVYVEFIREAKLAAPNGKLTNEQMKEALDKAWKLTQDDLLAQGIDLAKWIAREYFPVVVDKILKAVKKN